MFSKVTTLYKDQKSTIEVSSKFIGSHVEKRSLRAKYGRLHTAGRTRESFKVKY